MALRRLAGRVAGGRLSTAMARLNARHPWSHNDHFHSWILANLPRHRRAALDVGCGRGELLSVLAAYFETVHGNDVDEEMRAAAGRRCAGLPGVTIPDGRWTDLPGPYDLVTMVAVLHHLDASEALHRVREVLAPGGRFLVVGLAPPVTAVDHVWDLASTLTNPLIGVVKHPWPHPDGPQPPTVPVVDPTASFDEVRECVSSVMPGAVARRRLGFRYTIAWTKPA